MSFLLPGSLALAYHHGDDKEYGAYVGSEGQEAEGGQEGEEDEDGQEDGIHLIRAEADHMVMDSDRDAVEHPLQRERE